MRSTIHLVSRLATARLLRPLIQPVLNRGLGGTFGRRIAGAGHRGAGRGGPGAGRRSSRVPSGSSAPSWREHWPDRDATALAAGGPRPRCRSSRCRRAALWGASGTGGAHVGGVLAGRPARPATGSPRRWSAATSPRSARPPSRTCSSGRDSTRLGEVVERLRPRAAALPGRAGRECSTCRRRRGPDPDTPAPVRFVAEFDNLLLSHADRTRVIADEHRPPSPPSTASSPAPFSSTASSMAPGGSPGNDAGAVLRIRPFGRVPSRIRSALTAEGARLLAFAVPDAEPADIEFTDTESTDTGSTSA